MPLLSKPQVSKGWKILVQLLEQKRMDFLLLFCMEVERLRKFVQLLNDILIDCNYHNIKISKVFVEKIHSFQFKKIGNEELIVNENIVFSEIAVKKYTKVGSGRGILSVVNNSADQKQHQSWMELNKANADLFQRASDEILRLQAVIHQLSIAIIDIYNKCDAENYSSDDNKSAENVLSSQEQHFHSFDSFVCDYSSGNNSSSDIFHSIFSFDINSSMADMNVTPFEYIALSNHTSLNTLHGSYDSLDVVDTTLSFPKL